MRKILTYIRWFTVKRIVYSLLVGLGIFFASFLIPVIGGIISIPMGLIGAWIYYDYKK